MPVPSFSRAAERRAQRTQQIVDTASQLFSERGYENVTLRAIAEKLGYAHAALYRYFPDKASLLGQICKETFAQLTVELDTQQREAQGPEAELLAVSLGFVRFGLAHPHHYQVVFSSPLGYGAGVDDPVGDIGRPLFERLMQTFLTCSEALGMNADTRRLDAHTWWISLFGTTHVLINSCAVIGLESSDEVLRRHVEVMWQGFRTLTLPAGQKAIRTKPSIL